MDKSRGLVWGKRSSGRGGRKLSSKPRADLGEKVTWELGKKGQSLMKGRRRPEERSTNPRRRDGSIPEKKLKREEPMGKHNLDGKCRVKKHKKLDPIN